MPEHDMPQRSSGTGVEDAPLTKALPHLHSVGVSGWGCVGREMEMETDTETDTDTDTENDWE